MVAKCSAPITARRNDLRSDPSSPSSITENVHSPRCRLCMAGEALPFNGGDYKEWGRDMGLQYFFTLGMLAPEQACLVGGQLRLNDVCINDTGRFQPSSQLATRNDCYAADTLRHLHLETRTCLSSCSFTS